MKRFRGTPVMVDLMMDDVLVATKNEMSTQGLVVLIQGLLKSCGDYLSDLALAVVGDSSYQGTKDRCTGSQRGTAGVGFVFVGFVDYLVDRNLVLKPVAADLVPDPRREVLCVEKVNSVMNQHYEKVDC